MSLPSRHAILRRSILTVLTLFLSVVICGETASAQGLRLRDICRLKGQESNTLQGLGLVVGLRGTGDTDSANTTRALARMMQLMGGQIALDPRGQLDLTELSEIKNVAAVIVSAQVPPVGAQAGDHVDIVVNALNAKSLEGGYLVLTPLLGPQANNPTVYAMASGRLSVSSTGPPTTAVVERGAKIEKTIQVPYMQDGKITLIIDRDFADFDTSQSIVDTINTTPIITYASRQTASGVSPNNSNEPLKFAKAIDQLHVEVIIPEIHLSEPISFISELLDAPISLESKSNRVVINEREGIVIIGENVEIAPALVQHKNLRIDANAVGRRGGFVPVDSTSPPPAGNPKLKALADALNALDVPAADMIAIIKSLKAKGDLYGEVVQID